MAKYIVVHSVKVATEFVSETFGRLTTIGPVFRLGIKSHQTFECVCGQVVATRIDHVRAGKTKSCGCWQIEKHLATTTKHGLSKEDGYGCWKAMLARCYNKNDRSYSDYGGKGIYVFDRWRLPAETGFVNFIQSMGPRPSKKHSIERKANKGHYLPDNCVWATAKEQANNRRSNLLLEYSGKIYTATELANEAGLHISTLIDRINAGLSVSEAVTRPVKSRQKAPDVH